MTPHENLERLKKRAHRITKEEKMAGNLHMFEGLGLDEEDIARMAEVVDLELEDLLLLHPSHIIVRSSTIAASAKGRPGRKVETKDIADFANARRPHMSWREIYLEWRRLFSDDARVKSKENIREAFRRHYGDKADPGRNKKP